MGMAASQARHISLVARKTNVEWEGQQINQARTALANKTASLFNQMLGMTVPDCPDTTDFTKVQYSYSDGLNASTIDSYYQISNPEPEYNYVVTHSYFTDVYTGSLKKLNDPQVQTDLSIPIEGYVRNLNTAKEALEIARNAEKEALLALRTAQADLEDPATTTVSYTGISQEEGHTPYFDEVTGAFKYEDAEGAKSFTKVTEVTPELVEVLNKGDLGSDYKLANLKSLMDEGKIYEQVVTEGGNSVHRYVGVDKLQELIDDNTKTSFDTYVGAPVEEESTYNVYVDKYDAYITAVNNTAAKKIDYNNAVDAFSGVFTNVGNCPVKAINLDGDDAEAIRTELNQVVKDLKKDNINASILESWDNTIVDGDKIGDYIDGKQGTIFEFTMNNVRYFTTLEDLVESYTSGTGNNHIDGQTKMPYYSANYVSTKITKTERALLETDGAGRFTSVKFEDDTVKYILNTETITDTEAYDNAMNQYYYEVQRYEKTIADINAQTEIIQNQDRTLELRLKQLDTEESALSNEIDAVKKVLKDNVEKSFKTFSE